MTEENQTVTEPEDNATIVHDDPVAAEEKADAKLAEDVAKMLDKPTVEDGAKPDEEKPSKAQKPKDEEPADLGDELQARAEGAGMSKDLAQRLHQTGQLEETLAAFDRRLIERFQSEETEEKEEPKRREKPPPTADQEDAPELDPDLYDEAIVKRDAHYKGRIDALEAQVAELLQREQGAFDKRFDRMVDGLGHEDLFGKGDSVPKDKQAKRDILFRAYEAVCQAYGVDPTECNPQWGERAALAAMFPDAVFKQAQRQTVDRLRDAEGKFLSSSKPRGAPPAKELTEEESDAQLVSSVTAYLKKQGVQMSGV